MFTPNGEVSATLMLANRTATAPASEAEKAKAFAESFAYARRYEARDATDFLRIETAANSAVIGVKTTWHTKLDGGRLTLSGPDFSDGGSRAQEIMWRRSTPRT